MVTYWNATPTFFKHISDIMFYMGGRLYMCNRKQKKYRVGLEIVIRTSCTIDDSSTDWGTWLRYLDHYTCSSWHGHYHIQCYKNHCICMGHVYTCICFPHEFWKALIFFFFFLNIYKFIQISRFFLIVQNMGNE